MFELLAAGTVGFYLLMALFAVAFFLVTAFEIKLGFLLCVVAFVAELQFVSNVNILQLLKENPYYSVLIIGLYIALSPVWATIRWLVFCNKKGNLYLEAKDKFLESNSLDLNDPESVNNFKEWLRHNTRAYGFSDSSYDHNYYGNTYKEPIQDKCLIRNYKAKWAFWLSAWPIDMPVFLLKDMVIGFFSNLSKIMYNMLVGWLQTMADKIHANKVDAAVRSK